MSWKQTYYETIAEGISGIWRRQQFTDVTLNVQGRQYKAHRAILASFSPYFHSSFSSGILGSKRDPTIEITNINPDVFKKILSFIYTGEDVVNVDNAYTFYKAATQLQLTPLQVRCEQLLCDQITPETAISLWKNSKKHKSDDLVEKSWEIILSDFPYICTSVDFLTLDADELVAMIQSDDLSATSEEMVIGAAMRWINAEPKERTVHAGKIFEHLKLPLVSPEYLIEMCEKNEFLAENGDCRQYVEEAKKYHMLPARRHDLVSKRATYRQSGARQEVLLTITGGSAQPVPTSVLCFSLHTKKWYTLAPLPHDPGVEFAACQYANYVFISGGSRKLQNMLRYDCDRNEWHICEPLMQGRSRHAMVSVRDAVYAIGGHNRTLPGGGNVLCTIEKYTIGTGKWTTAGELPVPVEMLSAAAVGEKIFTFGGAVAKKSTNAIQCYDTRLGTATLIDELPMACRLTRAITCDKTVHIITTDGRFIDFQDGFGCRKIGKIPDFYRLHFGAAQHNGKIFIIGGKSDDNTLRDDIVTYDVKTGNVVELKESLPFSNVVDICLMTTVKRESLYSEFIPPEKDEKN